MPEDVRRQPSQGEQLEGVGQQRGQHRQPESLDHVLGGPQVAAGQSGRQHHDRGDDQRDREPVELRKLSAGAAAEQDVRRPEHPRRRRQDQARSSSGRSSGTVSASEISSTPAPAAATAMKSSGRRDSTVVSTSGPRNSTVTATPRGRCASDAVEAPVHQPERHPERHHGHPCLARVPAQPRPGERQEDQRRERDPQQHRPAGPDLRHQRGRQRPAELHRHHPAEHQQRSGNDDGPTRHDRHPRTAETPDKVTDAESGGRRRLGAAERVGLEQCRRGARGGWVGPGRSRHRRFRSEPARR